MRAVIPDWHHHQSAVYCTIFDGDQMINWHEANSNTKFLRFQKLSKIITAENYGTGDGQWTLTELIQEEDPRKYHAYQILDGVNETCTRVEDVPKLLGLDGMPFKFRFKVLSKQACCKTVDGKKIYQSKQAFEDNDENGILPLHDEKPVQGDVVEWKNNFRKYDAEKNRKVTGKVLQEWALRDIRPETYNEYIIDKDGCISVPYPFALSMLQKKGKNLSFPHFRKQARGKNVRRITNWCFKEVSQDFKAPKK